MRTAAEYREAVERHERVARDLRGDLTALGHIALAGDFRQAADELDMVPQRVQRQRAKGWRMPAGTVYVGRGTRWGNPFGGRGGTSYGPPWHEVTNADPRSPVHMPREVNLYVSSSGLNAGNLHAVELYRSLVTVRQRDHGADWLRGWLAPLVGKNLACWCPPDQPCHADVLLELAHTEEVEVDDL